LNIKKATGYDGISPKILKLSMPCIVEPWKLKKSVNWSKIALSTNFDIVGKTLTGR
jgi:hypothetical protein